MTLAPPSALSMQAIAALQRSIGNAAVAELLGPAGFGAEPETEAEGAVGEAAGEGAGGVGGMLGGMFGSAGGALGEAAGQGAGAAGGMLGGLGGMLGGAAGQGAGAAGGMLGGLGGMLGGAAGQGAGAAGGMLGGLGGALGEAAGGGIGAAGGMLGGLGGAFGEAAGQGAGGVAGMLGSAGGALGEAAGASAGGAAGAVGGMLGGLGGMLGEAAGQGAGAAGGMLGGLGGALGEAAGQGAGTAGGVLGDIFGVMTGGLGGLLGGIGGALGGALGGLVGSSHQAEAPVHPNGKAATPSHAVEPEHGASAAEPTEATATTNESEQDTAPAPAASGETTEGAAGFDPDAPPPLGETIPEHPEPAEPEVGPLGRVGHRPKAITPPKVGHVGAAPQPDHGGFEQEAQGIEGSTAGAGGGGILDTIIQAGISLLGQITGGVAGTARGIAGAVGGRVGSTAGQVTGTATAEGQAVATEAEGTATSASTEAGEHVGAAHGEAQGAVTHAMNQVKAAPGLASGQMEGLVGKVLEGAPAIPTLVSPFGGIFTRVLQALPGLMMAALGKAESVVNGVLTRATDAVKNGTQRLGQVIGQAGAAVEGALDWVAAQAASLRVAANERLSGLPSMVRSVLSGVVNSLLGAVAGAAARIAARARLLIDMAVKQSQAFLQIVTSMIVPLIDGVRRLVTGLLAGLRGLIGAAVAKIGALKNWLLEKAAAFIARAIRAVIGPIYQRAYDHLMALIGPEVEEAMARAQLMFPNGLPAPPEVNAAALKAASQAGSKLSAKDVGGLFSPQGDHFSIGFQLGGGVGEGIGVSGGGGASFEVVMDYRRNDIGFFIGPQGGGQVNLGTIEGTGKLTGMGSWGTVSSFGEESDDVLQSWSGWFSNVSYGYQAGAAYGVGAAVTSGGSFYRSGAAELDPPLFSYTPINAGSHTVKGAKRPDVTVPGTPATSQSMDLGEVRFASQQSDAEAAAGGSGAMDNAKQVVKDVSTKDPNSTVGNVSVVGEASRIWKAAQSEAERLTSNQQLAKYRADSVKAGLDQRLGGDPSVSAHGSGDGRARLDGRPITDGSAEYRRATMFADVTIGGTPDQTIPGGTEPDHEEPNKMDVKAGVPNPFTSKRTAWGWDTSLGIQGMGGIGASAGVFGGLGISYSFPIGKAHFSESTMKKIRVAAAIVKILADVISLSPLALIRDIVALVRGHVAADAQPAITNSVTKWTVPLPAGVAVA